MTLAPVRLTEAADSLRKASTPEPFSTSRTSNWVARTGGLPPYIQHIAHDLMEKRGKSESNAIQMAIGIVRNWARGQGKVDANTRAAASKAVAEFEAKRGAAKAKVSESRRLPTRSVSLADKATLRSAALARLRAIEQAFDAQMMLTLMESSGSSTWSPELKRTASAGSEGERMEVHHEGQQVGTLASRKGYAPGGQHPIRWNAKAVNGKMVGDTEETKEAALTALRKHLEEGPARVGRHANGKWLVANPESYGGQVSYSAFPSESTARFSAGLPEKETAPERESKIAALGEMVAFDLITLGALGEELPASLAPLAEAGFERAFDEAKHPRGPHGKFAVGDRVNYQHTMFGRVPAHVTKVTSRHVVVKSTDERVSGARSLTHKQAEERLSVTTKAKPAAGRMEDKVTVGGLPTTRGAAYQQALDAAKAQGHPNPKASADRFMQGLDRQAGAGAPQSDRHGGYKVGDKVVYKENYGVGEHAGEVVALHRNGNLHVREPKFGTTVDVHHKNVRRMDGQEERRQEAKKGVELVRESSSREGRAKNWAVHHNGKRVGAKLARDEAVRMAKRLRDKTQESQGGLLGTLLEGAAARTPALQERSIDQGKRKELAKKGHALPDGSYPIESAGDLANAAKLAQSGHGDSEAAKRLIAKRAKQLGVSNPLAS